MASSWINNNYGDEDEESDNDFNPGAVNGSDDEGDKNADIPAPAKPAVRQKDRSSDVDNVTNGNARHNGDNDDDGEDDEGEGEDLGRDDDDDEDEEDDEEDEDDEDAVTSRPRKRRRRGLNQFFEEEAEVDEDDDEVEAEEDELGQEFIQDTHPDDDLPPEADHDDRRHRELDRKRQLEAGMDAEKQAAELKERYGRRTTAALRAGAIQPQTALMPSIDDSDIWGIRCKQGKEREIIARINKKFMESQSSRKPMNILCAFERGEGAMAGYIFVEGRKQAVEEALTNVPDVYPRGRMNIVPITERPDLLRVTKSKELVEGGYVRIKRGLYQGDLGMIHEVEDNGLEVTVRLVPRLSYGADEDDQGRNPAAAAEKRKRFGNFGAPVNPANRPRQALFNENEAKKRHGRFLSRAGGGLTGGNWSYKNENYTNGFLIKPFKLQMLITENVSPKLEEITKLTQTDAEGAETLDLETLKRTIDMPSEGTYVPGDEVEVWDGEQKGVVGTIETLTGNIISIKISRGELVGQIVETPIKGVRKRFREGDHVKVVGTSKYRDETGMVLAIKDDRVTFVTDNNQQEVTVFNKDLRKAVGGGAGGGQSSRFDVQDLVQIDATSVGIVVRADRDSVRILDQNGSITTRLSTQVSRLEARKNAVATDKNGSEIRHGDVVRESIGEGKTGTILHIHRGFIFAHNRTQIEDSGLWVARCGNVVTTAAKGGRINAPTTDLTKLNPALAMKNGGPGMAPPQRPGRDRLQGQQVQIRKGPYKGHRGLVKDTTATVARIELQSKNKTVNVEKQDLMVVDRNSGKQIDFHSFSGSRGGPHVMRTGGAPGSRIPDSGFGGRTPIVTDGGRTPAWNSSSRTPAWNGAGAGMESGRTPAYRPSGSQTAYGGAGSTTSYGGAGNYGTSGGGRTPAWSSNARTPYGADHGGFGSSNSGGSFDAFASGSRTPAYGSNSARTPAWSGGNDHNSAPTPAADAPTPAASAPTPGAFNAYTPYGSAPTPGGRMDAPTPGYSAQTPYDAPTPAAGGPRYAEDDDDD